MKRKPDFERLEKVLRLEGEPDVVPFYEHLVDEEIVHAVLKLPRREETLDQQIEEKIRFYKGLGYDYVPMEINWPFPRKNFVSGPDSAPLPRAERTWVDQMHGTIETWEDFHAYPWPDSSADYSWPVERLSRAVQEPMKVIGHAAGGVLENTMWLMGAKPFIRSLYTQRDLVEAVFEKVGSSLVEAFGQISDVEGVGAICLGDDMGLRTGTMIPPALLRKYVFPWHRKLCRVVHSRDLPFILHACGNLTQVMDDLVDFVGIDAKHSYEDAIMPVSEVKERWGDRIAVLGGVDVDVLTRKDPETTAQYVRRLMGTCLAGGGWALGSGNSIPNYVNLESYLAMLRVGERIGRYPV